MEMYWVRLIAYASAPFIMLAACDRLKSAGVFAAHCPECRHPLDVEDKTLAEPTATTDGQGVRVRTCPSCGYRDQREFSIGRYQGKTTAAGVYSLRFVREDWKRVNADTVKRSEADSARRRPPQIPQGRQRTPSQ